ncbi:MAG: hypothetical protein SX243_05235 [Acidobacteriota bacterium]|nr:hypothetical protein [Acidobacteriota bacterium]
MNATAEQLDSTENAPEVAQPEAERPVVPPPPAVERAPGPGAPPAAAAENASPPLPKSPLVAALLAFFPGIGHIYNGLYYRGVVFFALVSVAIVMVTLTGAPFFGFLIPFLILFNILDSYRQAKLINLGFATDLGLLDDPGRPRLRPGQGTMVAGVALILVGVLELMARFGLWEWMWLADYWPVPMILIGAWLVIAALKERSRSSAATPDPDGYDSGPYAG